MAEKDRNMYDVYHMLFIIVSNYSVVVSIHAIRYKELQFTATNTDPAAIPYIKYVIMIHIFNTY